MASLSFSKFLLFAFVVFFSVRRVVSLQIPHTSQKPLSLSDEASEEELEEYIYEPFCPGTYDPEPLSDSLNAPPVAPPFVTHQGFDRSFTECIEWLEKIETSIQFHYGMNDNSSEVNAVLNCLRIAPEAAPVRERITEIFIVFPLFGETDSWSKSLAHLILILPNLKSLRFPCQYSWRLRWKRELSPIIRDAYRSDLIGKCYYYDERNIKQFPDCDITQIEMEYSRCQCNRTTSHENYRGCYFGDKGENGIISAYKSLMTCPTIESLSFYEQQRHPLSFTFQAGDRFLSKVKRIILKSYDWAAPGLDGQTQAKTWASVMDWSHVEDLTIEHPPADFISTFTGQLPSLSSLSIIAPEVWQPYLSGTIPKTQCQDFSDHGEDASMSLKDLYFKFASALPPLKRLSLFGLNDLLAAFVSVVRRGSSLEELRMHSYEHTTCPNATEDKYISETSLKLLQQWTPNLRILEIDLEHDGPKIPYTKLDVCKKWKKLEDVTLRFPLKNSWSLSPADNTTKVFMFNRTSIYSIFEEYFPTAKSLYIWVGEGSVAELEFYQVLGVAAAGYHCSRSEEADAAPECRVTGMNMCIQGPGKWESEGWIETTSPQDESGETETWYM
ncbi:uncharacterized protein BDR25DRAFT_341851, partial [Lindgomyces ingoldianus]